MPAQSMNKSLKNLTKILPGIAAVIFAVQNVSANQPYLASVGPKPLRFEVVSTNNALFLAELTLPAPKALPQPPMPPPASKSAPEETNAVAEPGPMELFPANPASTPGNPASNMLNMSPKMIDDYFKPTRGDGSDGDFQRGQSIFVPSELRFVPPMPQSRAIYISK
jgi:hypothetical protein